jgi:hypothetical protein
MPNQTLGDAVIDQTVQQLNELDCVESVVKSSNKRGSKLVATVRDAVAKETLKAELNDIVTPVYVDIQIA